MSEQVGWTIAGFLAACVFTCGIIFGGSCRVLCEQERTKRHAAEIAAFGRALPLNASANDNGN